MDTHGHTTEWILPRPDEYSVFFLHIGFLYSPPACEKNIPQDGLLAFAIGDLLVPLEVLGIPKDLDSPARLVVEDQRTPITWGFHATGNADLPTDWKRGDSAYD